MNYTKVLIFLFAYCLLIHASSIAYRDSLFTITTELDSSVYNVNVIGEHLNILKILNDFAKKTNLNSVLKDSIKYPQFLNMYNADVFGITYTGECGISFNPSKMVKEYRNKNFARNLTDEESNYFYKNNYTISPSIRNINENKAIHAAKEFFVYLLKLYNMQNDISIYDSVSVSYGKDRYIITFKARMRNFIDDIREAQIEISPLNGQVLRFYTPMGLILNRNLNYKPRISYEKVIEIIENYKIENNIKTESKDIELSPSFMGFPWVWVLVDPYLRPGQRYARWLVIDSNTGEIKYSSFGPEKQ